MLEKSYQDTFQDREKCKMAFQSTQNENISLKTQLYELEFKCEKGEERYKNELHHLKDLHQIEKASLDKRICGVNNSEIPRIFEQWLIFFFLVDFVRR